MSTSPSRADAYSSKTQTLRDKAAHTIIPTFPSPTNASITLTQSTSNSTPPTSPLPTTPRTSRSRTRYPDLGRVPLHRRGTSKTYERLEDLLREAGYKETRIFTPEGEHDEGGASYKHEVNPNFDNRVSMRGGVGAVVGFLAGLIPGATVNESSSTSQAESSGNSPGTFEPLPEPSFHAYSPPASPLTYRRTQEQKQSAPVSSEVHSPTTIKPSIENVEPAPRASRPPTTPVTTQPSFAYSRLSRQEPQRPRHQLLHCVSDHGSQTSHHQTLVPPTNTNHPSHPHPSRAGAYLRHIASAPNIPKRPSSTTTHSQGAMPLKGGNVDGVSRSSENVLEGEPPLPRTWLENVARAVLFGGIGAYVGGPSKLPDIIEPLPSSPQGKTLRQTRSSLSQVSARRVKYSRPPTTRSGLSDQTNTRKFTPNDLLAPPGLFTRIERGRSEKSTGEVSQTRVVCRSAPTSRGNSRVRNVDSKHAYGRDKGLQLSREGKRKGKHDKLPTLASTETEGDPWTKKRNRASASGGGNRYLSGWGVEPSSDQDRDDEDRQSSSEDEEPDLARILVPPKRQNSIKSLRKHLQPNDEYGLGTTTNLAKAASTGKAGQGATTGSAKGSRSGSVRRSTRENGWGDSEAEEWGQGWAPRRRSPEDDDDDESYAEFLTNGQNLGIRNSRLGSGRSRTGRSRLGLPGPWGLIGGGS